MTAQLFVGTLYNKSLALKSAEKVKFLKLCEISSGFFKLVNCSASSTTAGGTATLSAHLLLVSFVFFDRVKLSMPSMMIFFFASLKLRNFESDAGDFPGDFLLCDEVGDIWLSTFDAFGDVLRMPTWFMRSSEGIDRFRCVRFAATG